MRTSSESWFRWLANMSDDERSGLEIELWAILEEIFEILDVLILNGRRGEQKSFEEHFYKVLCATSTKKACFPNLMIWKIITESLLNNIRKWLLSTSVFETPSSIKSIVMSQDEKVAEVQRFLGYGIASGLKTARLRYNSTSSPIDQQQCDYFKRMRILKDDMDIAYKLNFYPQSIDILNQGGMALVQSALFPYGLRLLEAIRDTYSVEHIQRTGNEALKISDAALKSYHLEEEFITGWNILCTGLPPVPDDVLRSIWNVVQSKTIHSRCNVDTTKFKALFTSRHANKDGSLALRHKLKAITGTGESKTVQNGTTDTENISDTDTRKKRKPKKPKIKTAKSRKLVQDKLNNINL